MQSRNSPTVTTFVPLTAMKSVLLTFVGVCVAWTITRKLGAQTVLGDTGIRDIPGVPPVPDADSPSMTRQVIHINGVECE